jgi:hypothetical protein
MGRARHLAQHLQQQEASPCLTPDWRERSTAAGPQEERPNLKGDHPDDGEVGADRGLRHTNQPEKKGGTDMEMDEIEIIEIDELPRFCLLYWGD